MLGDGELQSLDTQLNDYVETSRQHHETHQNLMHQFRELLENYHRLKSDYEEEKESREKYKKLARGQERNPFALVLVDGDGYIFKDQHIKAQNEGGVAAAQILSNAIKKFLQSRISSGDTDQCRIMVRVYANLAGLSKTLSRAGLVGHEARSFAPFTASFTRSQDLFDFIDAGDKKEGADFKIREMFRLFADNNQCKHIFFAGCHDVGYLSLLTPYRGKADRVTLIKAASFHPEFESLDLPVREIASVFRSTPLAGSISNSIPTMPFKVLNANGKTKICKFHQKGICKYGNDCLNEHIDTSNPNGFGLEDSIHRGPMRLPSTTSPFNGSPSSRFRQLTIQDTPSLILPIMTPDHESLIPINRDGERLEEVFLPPSEGWQSYQQRSKTHKVCNKYHLSGECTDMDCKFDHTELEPQALTVLRYIVKQSPCIRGGKCRLGKCYSGHICQRDGCKGSQCRFKPNKHIQNMDFNVAEWVAPEDGDMINEHESPLEDPGSIDLLSERSDTDEGGVGGVESW